MAHLGFSLCVVMVVRGRLFYGMLWLFTSRTRLSPKRVAKKLFVDEDTMDDDGDGCADGAAVAAEPRYLLAFVYGSVFMFSRYALFFNCCCS